MSVATAWSNSKGLSDYYELRKILQPEYLIVLVGLNQEQIKALPSNIIGFEKTASVQDLVFLYNMSSVVTSLSYVETFGLTLVESMACGTPVVAYNNTGQASLVTDEVGRLVSTGDIEAVKAAIEEITSYDKEYFSTVCRKRAVEKYDKNARFMDYINLYNELIQK